jgi:hypothetical protein
LHFPALLPPIHDEWGTVDDQLSDESDESGSGRDRGTPMYLFIVMPVCSGSLKQHLVSTYFTIFRFGQKIRKNFWRYVSMSAPNMPTVKMSNFENRHIANYHFIDVSNVDLCLGLIKPHWAVQPCYQP